MDYFSSISISSRLSISNSFSICLHLLIILLHLSLAHKKKDQDTKHDIEGPPQSVFHPSLYPSIAIFYLSLCALATLVKFPRKPSVLSLSAFVVDSIPGLNMSTHFYPTNSSSSTKNPPLGSFPSSILYHPESRLESPHKYSITAFILLCLPPQWIMPSLRARAIAFRDRKSVV